LGSHPFAFHGPPFHGSLRGAGRITVGIGVSPILPLTGGPPCLRNFLLFRDYVLLFLPDSKRWSVVCSHFHLSLFSVAHLSQNNQRRLSAPVGELLSAHTFGRPVSRAAFPSLAEVPVDGAEYDRVPIVMREVEQTLPPRQAPGYLSIFPCHGAGSHHSSWGWVS